MDSNDLRFSIVPPSGRLEENEAAAREFLEKLSRTPVRSEGDYKALDKGPSYRKKE